MWENVLVATAQQFCLKIIAALDYIDWVKPVMDGIKPWDPACKAEHCIGMFTWGVSAAQLYFKAQIPVFFICPWELFSNQVILCVVKLSPTETCTTPPACPFPIMFDGPPLDPKKYVAQHRHLHLFQGYHDLFNFHTISSSTAAAPASSVLPSSSSRTGLVHLQHDVSHHLNHSSQVGCPKNKKIANNISRENFADLCGDYAPVAISAWSNALSSINEESASPDPPVATTYMFPNPILITNANAMWQKAYL
ncbi:hypothetical protein ARMGADRAFT_1032482 [Armillaria gallica]|uniref:Uncharacterized protein n=1 Tax=Armillaria gallica TaxID=47427 RepID=A0A2H3DHX5_ARMGA|nr:hypothetical protein ARMGADRAFT_1032482 [Armillaria gallica]